MNEPKGETASPSIREAGERVRDDLASLYGAAGKQTSELVDTVRSYVDEHPYVSVGAAFGLGYVLSGALVSRTTARVAAVAGRVFLGRLLKQALAGGGLGFLASDLLGGSESTHRGG